jgi:hypothetical protein
MLRAQVMIHVNGDGDFGKAANFLKDVNARGTITLGDLGIANANFTHALPPP